MTVEELLGRISSRELSEWQAYFETDPFGEERADLRAGIIAAIIANIYRKKGAKPFKPSDFMPKYRKQGPEDHLKIIEGINALMGGEDLRKK